MCVNISGEVLPWVSRKVSGKHGLYWLVHLVLCAHTASFDIVSNVGICAGPIDSCSGKELHLLSTLVAVVEICQGSVVQL